MEKKKAIIFDLDGTLFNSIGDIAAACNKMLSRHGYPVHPVEKYIHWVGNGALKLVERALPKAIAEQKELVSQLHLEYEKLYYGDYKTNSSLYKGIPEILNFLTEKNIPFSINTNKPHDITVKVVEHFFAPWQFAYIYGQTDEETKKPNPEKALLIAKKLNIPPKDFFFIGDSDVDAQTGKNAGMTTVGVAWGYRKIDESTGFNHIVQTPRELLNFLKEHI